MLCEPRVQRGSPASAQTSPNLLYADVFRPLAPRIFREVENADAFERQRMRLSSGETSVIQLLLPVLVDADQLTQKINSPGDHEFRAMRYSTSQRVALRSFRPRTS